MAAMCGEVPATPNANGTVTVPLRGADRSTLTGIAYLSPDAEPARTTLVIFDLGSRDAASPG